MISRLTTIAVLAGAALMSPNAIHASHLGYPSTHIILGRAYFYTLDVFSYITKLTGRDLRDGTQLVVYVKIGGSATACFNPQSKAINPGTGPRGSLTLLSDTLNEDDVVKGERTKSTFATTASGELTANRLGSICKESQGQGNWVQLYWQDRDCNKGSVGNTCYGGMYSSSTGYPYLAAFDGLALKYVTGPYAGYPVNDPADWMFVFIPSAFAMKAVAFINGAPEPDTTLAGGFNWSCTFNQNNEVGASMPGQPYSFNNPPVQGWGGPAQAEYNCVPITEAEYNIY